MIDPAFVLLVVLLALAAFACRAGGFWIMRYVAVTPRVQGALRAAPIAAMIGVVAPAAIRGGIAEWVGLVAIAVAMKIRPNDLVATFVGVIVVALLRPWAT